MYNRNWKHIKLLSASWTGFSKTLFASVTCMLKMRQTLWKSSVSGWRGFKYCLIFSPTSEIIQFDGRTYIYISLGPQNHEKWRFWTPNIWVIPLKMVVDSHGIYFKWVVKNHQLGFARFMSFLLLSPWGDWTDNNNPPDVFCDVFFLGDMNLANRLKE